MKKYLPILSFVLLSSTNHADTAKTSVYLTDVNKSPLGIVSFQDSKDGLLVITKLNGLPKGTHGLHLHQYANCDDAGMKAGGHYDPNKTNSHQGPYGKGHLGDLPVLSVNDKGEAYLTLIAPRLKMADLKGLTVMIHAGGDNYSDNPPLGGGGSRLACGVINVS